MPSNIEDIYRRLTAILLKGPRDPLTDKSPVYSLCKEILNKIGFSPDKTPVTGIALSLEEDKQKAVYIFLEKDVHQFASFITTFLGLADFRIKQLTTGLISPSGRPAQGGESLGEGATGGKSGTFGCLVEDAARQTFLLSCNHVLCNVNSGNRGIDPVWQPSYEDGGKPKDRIGVLHDFAPIMFGGTSPNEIDAALAKPDNSSDVLSGLKWLGAINGTTSYLPYRMKVEKVGWKTRNTTGTYLYRTNFIQHYPGHGDALFRDQLGIVGTIGNFSDNGDSGSVVVNDQREAVGLIFASAPDIRITFANPIYKVFNFFGVTPV